MTGKSDCPFSCVGCKYFRYECMRNSEKSAECHSVGFTLLINNSLSTLLLHSLFKIAFMHLDHWKVGDCESNGLVSL